MQIKKTIDRIPGGLMVVPLFLGALLNTLAPTSAKWLGSFTYGLTSGDGADSCFVVRVSGRFDTA